MNVSSYSVQHIVSTRLKRFKKKKKKEYSLRLYTNFYFSPTVWMEHKRKSACIINRYVCMWQVLLDSALDLEAPAHVSSAFSALVFLSPPEPLQAAVPVHGRYHKASSSGGWERVVIEPPRLLLRSEHCGWKQNTDRNSYGMCPLQANLITVIFLRFISNGWSEKNMRGVVETGLYANYM